MTKRWRRRRECEVCEGTGGDTDVGPCNECDGEGKVEMITDDALRDALAELAQAATWAANHPEPRKAMSGYSWYNVALEQVETIEPRKLLDPEQVRIFREAMRGGAF